MPACRPPHFRIWITLLLVLDASGVSAQVTLDGTLGPKGALSGPNFQIPAALGRQVGDNLFHSFGQFNVSTGESATFTGPGSIERIIGRVTGGQTSWIDGTLRSTIPNADLYLLNPAGIMFGPRASLDVNGAFHASTANYLRLGEEGRFDATAPQNTLLTSAPPSAFGFLGSNPARISVQGSALKVLAGKTLSLIGGDIEIVGDGSFGSANLSAPSGQINIISVASKGEVFPNVPTDTLDFGVNTFERLGEVNISQGALLNASGKSGGTVVIQGGRLLVENAFVFADTEGDTNGAAVGIDINIAGALSVVNGAQITTYGYGAGNSGNIHIRAGNVEVKRDPADTLTLIGSSTEGSGDGGNVSLVTGNLVVDRAEISTPTRGTGKGGNIKITADNISISGEKNLFAGIFANTFSSGNGGNIDITTTALRMTNRGSIQVSALGSGSAGNLRVTSDTLELKDGSFMSTSGLFGLGTANSGNINIITKSLLISGFGSAADPFSTDATGIFSDAKEGRSGDIRITATDSLSLTSRGSISSSSSGSGRGGNVEIATRQLHVLNGSNILASTFGSGEGGAIQITADEVQISGVHPEPFTEITGATSLSVPGIASQTGINGGNAGKVQITARRLQALDGGQLASDTFGTGQGGYINITTNDILVSGVSEVLKNFFIKQGLDPIAATSMAASSITAGASNRYLGEKATGNAGRITIQTSNLQLQNNGRITTTTNSSGVGGDIELSSNSITLSKNASILARSEGSGNAGNINITARDRFRSQNSIVATSANQAAGGNIEISARSIQLTQSPITASVTHGKGGGGNVTLNAGSIVALNNSDITAKADQGFGGNIIINADAFLRSPEINLDATSNVLGNEGRVAVNAPNLDLSASLVTLPSSYLNASAQLSQRCAAVEAGTRSSFVVRGWGTAPPEPNGLLPAMMEGCVPDAANRLLERDRPATSSQSGLTPSSP